MSELLRSPLDAEHRSLGARMVSFAGWEMPIQYESVMIEHKIVRGGCGVFDISHMGQLWLRGSGAEKLLNSLLTNDVTDLGDGQGQYTLMLNEKGGVIDDLIVYRISTEEFFLVVNASRIEEDVSWIISHLDSTAVLENVSPITGGIAIQGPGTPGVWEGMAGGDFPLPPRNGIAQYQIHGHDVVLCRTGYTGEDGFELFAPADRITEWWRRAINDTEAMACGLGARDTLRLEKGYPLNGNDLDETHSPLEAGLGYFVKLDKPDGFIGSGLLKEQKESGLSEQLIAIKPTGKMAPPRAGYLLCAPDGGEVIGALTSGTLSPTLGTGIGMGYAKTGVTKLSPGSPLELEVRGRRYPIEVVKKPFV